MLDTKMITGIFMGLGAATCQSVSYICNRSYGSKFPKKNLQLLVQMHVYMLFASLVLLGIFWPENMPEFSVYGYPLLMSTFSYLLAQACLFLSLRYTDASRVSPLLGFKVFMLAAGSALILDKTYSSQQWLAVILSIVSAAVLSSSGGRINLRSVFWIVLTCAGYSVSDVHIKMALNALTPYMPELLPRSCLYVGLSYTICGMTCLLIYPFIQKPCVNSWKNAAPSACCWFLAMILMMSALDRIDVVFANIVQASRGIISIIIGLVVSLLGFVHLEEKLPKRVFAIRLLAGCIMVGAIVLFSLGALEKTPEKLVKKSVEKSVENAENRTAQKFAQSVRAQ